MKTKKSVTNNYRDNELLDMVVTELNTMIRGYDVVTQHHGCVHMSCARLNGSRLEGCTIENEWVQVLVIIWGDEEWLPLSLSAYTLKEEMTVLFIIPDEASMTGQLPFGGPDQEEPTHKDLTGQELSNYISALCSKEPPSKN